MGFKQILLFLLCFAYSETDQSLLERLLRYWPKSSTGTTSEYKLNTASYDFIIVGSGTAGSAIANRLSETRNWKILLLEAGGSTSTLNNIPVIATYFQLLTDYNWGYKVEPQKNACLGMTNAQCSWPRGKALGGTSTLNYMIHTRGNKLDYDNWAAMGNDGWSYEDVLPYFKKSERFDIPELNNSTWHNENGNLCVEYVPYHTKLATAYLQAGKKMGYDIVDYNGKDQIGFSYIQANMRNGSRCSAAKAYLSSIGSNLEIITGARVTKVLFDEENEAYGVQYVKDEVWHEVQCSKEVILSAGTIDSAKLLMLSGIGPEDHLEELGINVIKNLKVGYNMYEHIGFLGLTFVVDQSVALVQNRFVSLNVLLDYISNRNGPLTVAGGAEAIAFVRTKYAQDARSDLELLFAGGSLNSDNGWGFRRAQGITDEIYNTVYRPIEGQDTWSIWPIVMHPRSVGRLKLRSNNPFDSPIMDPNFFDDPLDLEILLEGVKLAINISQSEAFRVYGTRLHNIKIPGCKSFEFATDDYWRCAIKHMTITMNHEIGTVKMGPSSDPDAVVDPQLRVYGVTKFRVADGSVMPTITTGHVNAPICMIGEKVADLIKQSWGEAD